VGVATYLVAGRPANSIGRRSVRETADVLVATRSDGLDVTVTVREGGEERGGENRLGEGHFGD
jgi:hypothetical protein